MQSLGIQKALIQKQKQKIFTNNQLKYSITPAYKSRPSKEKMKIMMTSTKEFSISAIKSHAMKEKWRTINNFTTPTRNLQNNI